MKQKLTSSICHVKVMTCPNTQRERLLYGHVRCLEEWSLSLGTVDCRLSFYSCSPRQGHFWASFIKHKYHIVVPLFFWFWIASVMAEHPTHALGTEVNWEIKMKKKKNAPVWLSLLQRVWIRCIFISVWDALNRQLKVGGSREKERRHGLTSRWICPRRCNINC